MQSVPHVQRKAAATAARMAINSQRADTTGGAATVFKDESRRVVGGAAGEGPRLVDGFCLLFFTCFPCAAQIYANWVIAVSARPHATSREMKCQSLFEFVRKMNCPRRVR